MNSRGGCCIARYGGAIDQIMLRYRPIAPKPPAAGAKAAETTTPYVKTSRGRGRKSSSENNSNPNKRSRKRKSTEKLSCKAEVQENTVVTLPLLPSEPVMLSFDGRVPWTRQKRVVGSWVIVERVTETWSHERVPLEEDTCPGFVSDAWNRVWWTNEAYKKMTETTSFDDEVVVWLVMKEKLPVDCDGFTCRVTVQSTVGHVAAKATVPCDVWRVSDGGFAWRLDVKAALTLGR